MSTEPNARNASLAKHFLSYIDDGSASAKALFEALLNKDKKRLAELDDLLVKRAHYLARAMGRDCVQLADTLNISGFTFGLRGVIGGGQSVSALVIQLVRHDEKTGDGCFFDLHINDWSRDPASGVGSVKCWATKLNEEGRIVPM